MNVVAQRAMDSTPGVARCFSPRLENPECSKRGLKHRSIASLFATACLICAARAAEVVIDFEEATIGKPVPTWTEKGVSFSLAEAPKNTKAIGRVMFFPHLTTNHKGLLNAMANEQAIPVQAKFPTSVSSVTIKFWASTGCAARLQALDQNDQVIDTASVAVVPGRKAPEDPVPMFELTVKGAAIASIRFSGPRNGEFLAADEVRFTPAATPK